MQPSRFMFFKETLFFAAITRSLHLFPLILFHSVQYVYLLRHTAACYLQCSNCHTKHTIKHTLIFCCSDEHRKEKLDFHCLLAAYVLMNRTHLAAIRNQSSAHILLSWNILMSLFIDHQQHIRTQFKWFNVRFVWMMNFLIQNQNLFAIWWMENEMRKKCGEIRMRTFDENYISTNG